jgi:hypothetical protein
VGQHPASEERAEFALDEAGYGVVSLSSPREKGLEVFANGLVEERRLGTTRFVISAPVRGEAGGVAAAEGAGGHSAGATLRGSCRRLQRARAGRRWYEGPGVHARRKGAEVGQKCPEHEDVP